MGRATPDSELDRIEEEQFVNEACVLVYTSGTTGKPKGVMVSQVRVDTQHIRKSPNNCPLTLIFRRT